MSRLDSTRSFGALLFWWPVIFGVALTLLRVVVSFAFGVRPVQSADIEGLLLGAFGQIAFGLLLALPLVWFRRSNARILIYTCLYLVVFLNTAAFHYEAVFWRLPGISLLYYIREAGHLVSSAQTHAPLLVVVFEVVLVGTLLVIAAEWLARVSFDRTGKTSRLLPVGVALSSVSVAFTIVAHFLIPSIVPREHLWSARVPILWALQSWRLRRSYESGTTRVERTDVIRFQEEIGHRLPFGGVEPSFPLCGDGPRFPGRAANGRSVIFLVLESVGLEEMALTRGDELVMPALTRIASDSVVMTEIKASGTKSLQAMPSLFAGIPPQPARNLLWRDPLNHLEGFPLVLRSEGYDTAYVHGGDLSFEQQRQFLRMVGFEEILELDFFEGDPFLGWGHDDDVVFRKLESWIDNHRSERPQVPYLTTLFTLSTHDPYIVPEGRERVFEGEGLAADFVESLRFLDEQLDTFYEWFLANEASRGTVLVITGDHAPHLSGDRHLEDDEVVRFDVPLIIRGVGSERLESVTSLEKRRGAHFDVPATILGILDVSPGACDQGVDLLVADNEWPEDRTLYSVAGDQLEDFYVWYPEADVHLDLVTRSALVRPRPEKNDLSRQAMDDHELRALEFLSMTRTLSAYLVEADGFAPSPSTVGNTRTPLPPVQRPMFVAHRGQSRGEVAPTLQNKAQTIEQSIEDGFDWVEVDVQLTRDDVPVLIHDEKVIDEAGLSVDVPSLTLNEIRAMPNLSDVMTLRDAAVLFGERIGLLIELKPQSTLRAHTALVFRSAEVVRETLTPDRVIMDSFSPFIAASLKQQCRCPVGQDAPQGRAIPRTFLDGLVLRELDWIYVHHIQASPPLIRDAHAKGLRVLVYTVNSLDEIEHLAGEWPDAVITDRADLVSEFDTSKGVR